MPRRPAAPCRVQRCRHLRPCPTPGHEPVPWEDSTRKDKLASRSGSAEQAARLRILERYHRICHVCGGPDADEVDHVIPLAEGGPDTDENKRPIHSRPCHKKKTAAEAARARARRREGR